MREYIRLSTYSCKLILNHTRLYYVYTSIVSTRALVVRTHTTTYYDHEFMIIKFCIFVLLVLNTIMKSFIIIILSMSATLVTYTRPGIDTSTSTIYE